MKNVNLSPMAYFSMICFILKSLKNPDSFRKIYKYSQDVLMKENESEVIQDD